MVRNRIKQKRQDNRDLDKIYRTQLKKEQEAYAKEKAVIRVGAMRDKARTIAREGRVKPVLKAIGSELKKHKANKGNRGLGMGGGGFSPFGGGSGPQFGGGSGPQFGLSNSTPKPKKKARGKTITIRL